jgi:hypothetical protein
VVKKGAGQLPRLSPRVVESAHTCAGVEDTESLSKRGE